VWWHEFPDHHAYHDADRVELGRAVTASGAELAVCTQKDLVKLPIEQLGGRPLWALAIELQILSGGDGLEGVLQRVLPRNRSND
jgi:tetraacyldisaccharide 4'-kinase